MYKFWEVYAKVIRLPLVMEVEFGIDLFPGTFPICMAPYYKSY